jgi:hypothetical protein
MEYRHILSEYDRKSVSWSKEANILLKNGYTISYRYKGLGVFLVVAKKIKVP